MAKPGFIGDFVDSATGAFMSGAKRTNMLNSNQSINSVTEMMTNPAAGGWAGGVTQSINAYRQGGKHEGDLFGAIKAAHKKDGDLNGNWDYGRIAGSAMTAGIGYRVLSGGGAYRDQNGQTNIAGVPFI